jgi:hypothetical protein
MVRKGSVEAKGNEHTLKLLESEGFAKKLRNGVYGPTGKGIDAAGRVDFMSKS